MNGNKLTWVDEVTPTSAANLNRLEGLVQDAVADSKQSGTLDQRPAASQTTKNWLWRDWDTGRLSYCDGNGWVETSPLIVPVSAVMSTNFDLTRKPTTTSFITDGYTVSRSGELFLLIGQTNPAENGVYLWNGNVAIPSRAVLTQSAHFVSAATFHSSPTIVTVAHGNRYAGTEFVYNGVTNPTVGVDAITFQPPAAVWTDFPLQAPYWGTQAGTRKLQYTVLPTGLAVMRGLPSVTQAVVVNAASAVIGTLPVGARPAFAERYTVTSFSSGAASPYGVVYLSIAPDGTVQVNVQLVGTAIGPVNSWVAMSGVTWPAEQ